MIYISRNCDGITYIVDAAQGFMNSKQLKTTKANIAAVLKELKKMKDSRQKHLVTLGNDKTASKKQVSEFAEGLIQRIRELEKATIDQINKKDDELSGRTRADVGALDDMIAVVEEDLEKLGQSQRSESQVFVDAKLGESHKADSRKLLQRTGTAHTGSVKFVLKTSISQFLHDLQSLGNFVDDSRVYKVSSRGEYSIKLQQDTATCNAPGSCLLADSTMMVTDWKNKRLKRLDASFRVTGHCDLHSEPWGVTCTAPDEVAVTMTDVKKVQFISVGGSMSMTRSFTTSDRCRGICYSNGELFVSCGGLATKGWEEGPGHVAVYSLHGDHLRTIQTDPSGQQIFSCPYHITASPDGSKIYVARSRGGVVSLDRSGSRVATFTDPSLKHAIGLCTLENGHILVCGKESHNVLQFDGDGRKLTELLKDTDGIKNPKSLCYDSTRVRLVVTMRGTDTIKVFDLI